jgi:hypothetical protein
VLGAQIVLASHPDAAKILVPSPFQLLVLGANHELTRRRAASRELTDSSDHFQQDVQNEHELQV